MAQTIEELSELLEGIKIEANHNAETFDKLLTSINNKLEFISNDTEADDLIKVYLTELKKTLEDRHALVVEEFNKITNSFNTLTEEQSSLAKTTEMKELFDIFSNNMQSIARELYGQKELLAQYDERFSTFASDKTDKNDIISSVNAVRKDVEIINQGFETSISDINANIQSIFKNLIVMDPTAQNDIVKRELENIYLSTNAILSALHVVDQKNDDLAQALENFITKDNFQEALGKLNDLLEKYEGINSRFNLITEKTDLDSLVYKTSEISEKINSLPLREDLKYFAEKNTELEAQIASLPQKDYIDNALLNTTEKIKEQIQNASDKFELENIIAKTDVISSKFEPLAEKNDISEVLAKTESINEKLNNIPTITDIDQIAQKTTEIETQLSNLPQQEDLADIYRNIHDFSVVLDRLRENLTSSNEEENRMIREQLDKLNSILSAVVTENDFAGFRHDLADFIQKIIDNTVSLNDNLNVNKDVLHNLINEIENLDIHKNIETIASALDGLRVKVSDNVEQLSSQIANVSDKVDNLATKDVEAKINVLSENLYDTSESLKSMNSELYEKLAKENENLSTKLDSYNIQSNFDIVNTTIMDNQEACESKLDNVLNRVDNISTKIENISSENLEQLSKDYEELKYTIENCDIANNLGNINSSVNNLQETSKDNVEKIIGAVGELSSKVDNISTENLEEKITELKDNLSETSLNIKSIKNDLLEKLPEDDSEKFSSLHNNIDFLRETIMSSQTTNETSLTEKLLALRNIITEGVSTNDENIKQLQSKLDDVIEKVKSISEDTEIKIGNSIAEITGLKNEIEQISKNFTEWNYGQEDRDSKIVNMISSELGEIGVTITTLQDSIQAGVHQELAKNSEIVEVQINNLIKYIDDLKSELQKEEEPEQPELDIETPLKEIKEKITAVKQEINLVNTDIIDVLNSKSEEIFKSLSPLKDSLEAFANIEENISSKLEENAKAQTQAIIDASQEVKNSIEDILNEYIEKLDIGDKITSSINELGSSLIEKLDEQNPCEILKDELSNSCENIKNAVNEKINSSAEDLKTLISVAMNNDDITWAIDNLKSDISDKVTRIFNERNNYSEILDKTNEISDKNTKISDLLDALNQKIDILALSDTDEDFSVQDEIDDIKDMILSQKQLLSNSASEEKVVAIENHLENLIEKINTIETTDLKDMRESILSTILNVFEQISFIEESEDIKDFVEEKTDEINQNLIEVKQQLKQITNNDDGYSYTLQDVESDIAKLRLVLNELSNTSSKEDISDISDNIHKIVTSVEDLQNSLTQEQISDLKTDFEKLSEDILSISSRTNKLLLTSDESYNALNNGLNDFSNIVYKLEERINYLDNKEITERIEEKLDNVANVVNGSANSDKVMRQALIYMGEWMDSTSENIESLCEKTDKIDSIEQIVEKLSKNLPEQKDLLDALVEKFDEQQERIDRLEMKLEKIINSIDDIDDTKLVKKVDKIDKQLTKLGNTIEKLATYVDE